MMASLSLALFYQTNPPFAFLFSSAPRAHPSLERVWWTKGSCSGV